MAQAIGIDFGGTSIKSGVVEAGKIIAYGEVIDTRNFDAAEALIDALLLSVAALRRDHHAISAIGVGLPGLVDSENGVVHELTNVPGWRDVSLRNLLRERTGLPATIENDANAMAYGEFRYGAARDARHVVCVTLGTGVGGALILDGRLYRGAQLGAGEIGHLSIDYRGRPGPYGISADWRSTLAISKSRSARRKLTLRRGIRVRWRSARLRRSAWRRRRAIW